MNHLGEGEWRRETQRILGKGGGLYKIMSIGYFVGVSMGLNQLGYFISVVSIDMI